MLNIGEPTSELLVVLGVIGGDDDADGDEKCCDVSTDKSEFLEDLALPLRYTPDGIASDRKAGSLSIVGRFCRSAYVKYAVRCHFLGFDVGDTVTHAE